jgi:hypothetical protein
VAAKMLLRRYFGHETLACGVENNLPETMFMLMGWADKVVIAHPDFEEHVFYCFRSKTICLDVGPDIWGNPFHEDLQVRIYGLIMRNPELRNGKLPTLGAVLGRLRKYRKKIADRNQSDSAV